VEETTAPSGKSGGIQIHPSPESIANIPQEGGLSYQEIYVKAIDSVVSITCQLDGGSSSGTGVVLTADGYLVTNAHVVEGAREITVGLTDGQNFTATLIGADSFSDLAVLHINATGLKAAEFGDSSVLRVGDAVAAIGNPLGTELWGSMTPGIISGVNREITTGGRTMTLIQTNAALNSGNSGGPLLNCFGQVVGINTMKMGDSMSAAGVEGLGFAIPSTVVQQIVNQLMDQGYVSGRPSLGIAGKEVSIFYQMYYRMPQGLYIDAVTAGSDAETAGLRPGDILMRLDGVQITGEDSLNQTLYSYQVGDTIEAEIYRYRTRTLYTITLTVEEANS
jgi:serine protease Do